MRLSSRLFFAALLLWGPVAVGQEWTRFRGPGGSGISPATTVPADWTGDDYNWTAKLPGTGHSSPVLWGRKIFLTSGDEESGKRYVFCLHADDGRQLWLKEFPAKKHGKHKLNSFASSTPAVDQERLYVCWGTPDELPVIALDHSGDVIWKVDLGGFKSGHGFGVSPILADGAVVIANEQQGDSSLVALEAKTGKTRWQVARNTKVTYSTPCLHAPPGRPAELIFTNWRHGITAVNPRTGKTNWEIDIFDKGHVETAIGSPIVAGDLILATCGWLGVRKETIAVRSGNKDRAAEVVYVIDRSAPLTTTPLVKDDLLFLWSDEGIVTCAEAATGKVFWRQRAGGTYYGSPVWVGGRLYAINVDGDVNVLAAAKQFQRIARIPLGEPSNSTPAIAEGVMYLRTVSRLYSLGGRKRAAE